MFLNEKLTTEKLISSNELLRDLKESSVLSFEDFVNEGLVNSYL